VHRGKSKTVSGCPPLAEKALEMDYKSTKVLMLGFQRKSILEAEKAGEKGPESVISNLRGMQGEYSQLSELEEMERNYAEKVIESLKAVQKAVEDPIPVDKAALGPKYHFMKEAFLASDAVIVLFDSNGISSAVPLSKFGAREILSIVQSVSPNLSRLIARKRKETGDRVELLERILKEMKKTGISVKRDVSEFQAPDEADLVSSSIARK
jgi:hypothetical protein